MAFCSECGAKLNDNAKFCHVCGVPTGGSSSNSEPQRQQEYVGKTLKCPNCGAPVDDFDSSCPSCGVRFSGKNANQTVERFKEELMAIEEDREPANVISVFTSALQLDPADNRKLSLIKNFPIPNSVDEVTEFMMLAIANINVALSKNTKWNNINKGKTIQSQVSEAWVAKMQQAYAKAKLSFPDDPAFPLVQEMYEEKMKELKIAID